MYETKRIEFRYFSGFRLAGQFWCVRETAFMGSCVCCVPSDRECAVDSSPGRRQVDGAAAAAGFQLVASCDIVVATPRSSFSTPGGNVGIFCSTPGIAVSRVLPRRLAAHLLLTGLPLSAEEAHRIGLVSRLVEPDQLQHETAHIAAAIVRKSRSVIALGKKFFYQQLELPIDEAYKLGGRLMVDNIALKDGQEGIKGFIEKREPTWTHTDAKAHD